MPVRVVTGVAELRDAKAAGDTAVVLHFQGSEPLRPGTDPHDLYAAEPADVDAWHAAAPC
jgi:microsomal dipeptidase-like Zn-dependent dipeptidase